MEDSRRAFNFIALLIARLSFVNTLYCVWINGNHRFCISFPHFDFYVPCAIDRPLHIMCIEATITNRLRHNRHLQHQRALLKSLMFTAAMKTFHERICKWNFHAASKSQAVSKHWWSALICPRLVYKVLHSNFSNESREPRIVDATLCSHGPTLKMGGVFSIVTIRKGHLPTMTRDFSGSPFFPMPPCSPARDPN